MFSFKNHNRLQNANTTVNFYQNFTFFPSQKQLQIENSGFVKTCDEHIPGKYLSTCDRQ